MGASDPISRSQAVILFDGICNLCSNSVQFVINRDPEGYFKFASLQSEYGQQQLTRFGLDSTSFHSIILVEGDTFYQRSEAALRIARKLSGGWFILYGFMVVPGFIRDGVYNLIGSNRYKLFGKKDACWLPTPDLKSRFLD